jgi:hypothetical protein
MLGKSGAKALVIDAQFATDAASAGIPTFTTLTADDLKTAPQVYLGDLPRVQEKDNAVIVHSSGTTSGMPKLIFQSHIWAKTMIQDKWPMADVPGYDTPLVSNSLGSLAHVGSFCGASISLFFACILISNSSVHWRCRCRSMHCTSLVDGLPDRRAHGDDRDVWTESGERLCSFRCYAYRGSQDSPRGPEGTARSQSSHAYWRSHG